MARVDDRLDAAGRRSRADSGTKPAKKPTTISVTDPDRRPRPSHLRLSATSGFHIPLTTFTWAFCVTSVVSSGLAGGVRGQRNVARCTGLSGTARARYRSHGSTRARRRRPDCRTQPWRRGPRVRRPCRHHRRQLVLQRDPRHRRCRRNRRARRQRRHRGSPWQRRLYGGAGFDKAEGDQGRDICQAELTESAECSAEDGAPVP